MNNPDDKKCRHSKAIVNYHQFSGQRIIDEITHKIKTLTKQLVLCDNKLLYYENKIKPFLVGAPA